MEYGLVICLVVMLVPLLVMSVTAVRRVRQMKQIEQELRTSGIPAQASILSITLGDGVAEGAYRRLDLRLTLRVAHPHRPPYEAQTRWLVHEISLAQVQPNQIVPVRIHRDHLEWVCPDVPWAEFWDSSIL